jgi:O-antigen ligase
MSLLQPKLANQLYYYLFLILAAVMPVHGRLVPPVISLIGLIWILEFNFITKYKRVRESKKRKFLLLFGVLYLLYVVGTIYSDQLSGMEGAYFDLEVKLSLLVFPLLFSTIDFSAFKKDFYSKLLKAFVVGCLLSTLFLTNSAVLNYFKQGDSNLLYYTFLSQMHHPSYLAMYVSFAIAIVISKLIVNNPKVLSKWFFGVVLILVFQVFIVMLSSKAGIIGLVIIYILAVLFSIFLGKKTLVRASMLSVVLIITFFITLMSFPYAGNRLSSAKEVVASSEAINVNAEEGTAARLLIWETSLEIIKENFLFGVGTGDVKQSLMEKYEERGITKAFKDHLNSHDQYLQTFIAIGVLGFLALLAGLFLPAMMAIRNKNMLYVLFIALISFHLLVESMFERQAGVVFYGFINVVLFYFANPEQGSDHQLP